jgi:abequosyltransferase
MQAVDKSIQGTQPLLTIAIPTYNRAIYLDLCLRRIAEELDSLSLNQRQLVKVYVSNNASTDNTAEVISGHRLTESGQLDVVHNAENMGAERNVAQCYTSATTPYVWVLGDDDVILPGGLRKILDALLQQDIDVLYMNNYWFKEDYTEHPSRHGNRGIFICRDSVDFARRTNVMVTFISGLIVRGGMDVEPFSDVVGGSNLPQLGWVLPMLRDGKCFAIIEDVVVAAKGSNSSGYGLVKVFGNNLGKISSNILQDHPKIARAIQNGTIVNFFPAFILEFRKGVSQFSDQNMADGLEQAFSDNWRYYVFLYPLISLPLPIARFYHVLLKIARRLFRRVLV